jgi:hypothetical protein
LANNDAPGLIGDPTQSPGHSAELTLRVRDPEHLARRLRDAEEWLGKENPLTADVAAEGILQPLTVAVLTIVHDDESTAVTLLSAADGSSRTSAAHTVLKADPADVAYRYSGDHRTFRQFVGRPLRLLRERGWDGLSETEQHRIRALVAPARIIIGFEPDQGRGLTFDGAIRNLIGLTHIRPPLPYGAAVENEAKADAVLDSLSRPLRNQGPHITHDERAWYAGLLTPAQAAERQFPPYGDVRAADITRALLHGGRRTARRVNDGIRSLTARQRPTPAERVDIVVELILRTVRTEHAAVRGYSITARRAALQRAYRLPEISAQNEAPIMEGLPDSGLTLEQLRDYALEELDDDSGEGANLGPVQVELATKAAYYMIVAEPMALRREGYSGDNDTSADDRTIPVVLRAMLTRRRGIYQAYAVIRNGRAQKPLIEVDDDGFPTTDRRGDQRVLTNELVRATYTNPPLSRATSGAGGARRRWAEIENSIDGLERAVATMRKVKTEAGNQFVDEQGWPTDQIRRVRERLDRLSRILATWGDRHDELHSSEEDEEELSDPEL